MDDNDDDRLSVSLTVRVTPEERDGLKWLAEQRAAELKKHGIRVKATTSLAAREAIQFTLKAKGWPGAASGG
ncbi:hypothetical protein BE21_02500 [Sorangium cellulosum]|uniref:Uncharacterized protein n=1 Tax=Sorangium cellulosum TaxID=56 RepID=A0A150TRZ0_SORCE|nr:hypothetical protein BE21_02500 [Sorangium cellulosum]